MIGSPSVPCQTRLDRHSICSTDCRCGTTLPEFRLENEWLNYLGIACLRDAPRVYHGLDHTQTVGGNRFVEMSLLVEDSQHADDRCSKASRLEAESPLHVGQQVLCRTWTL